MSTSVLSLFNFILYKDCIEKECQCDRWPQSIIKRLQVKSQGWAMCLCGAQLSSPHYLRHGERWIRALPHSLSYQLTRGEGGGVGRRAEGRGGWGQSRPGLPTAFVCLSHFTIHQPSMTVRRAFSSSDPSGPVSQPSQLRDEALALEFH